MRPIGLIVARSDWKSRNEAGEAGEGEREGAKIAGAYGSTQSRRRKGVWEGGMTLGGRRVKKKKGGGVQEPRSFRQFVSPNRTRYEGNEIG